MALYIFWTFANTGYKCDKPSKTTWGGLFRMLSCLLYPYFALIHSPSIYLWLRSSKHRLEFFGSFWKDIGTLNFQSLLLNIKFDGLVHFCKLHTALWYIFFIFRIVSSLLVVALRPYLHITFNCRLGWTMLPWDFVIIEPVNFSCSPPKFLQVHFGGNVEQV